MKVCIHGVELEVCAQNGWVWKQAAAGTWEPQTYSIIDRYVTPETTFIDIGAWVGPIGLYAAHKAKRVYSFEPDPVAFKTLEKNVRLNPAISNLTIFQRAIGLHDGQVRLGVRVKPGDSTSSVISHGQEGWLVACQRLQTFCREHDVQDPLFIKIDVEGYEYDLIPSLMPWLKGRRFIMHLSTHPHIIEQSIADNARLASMRRALARRIASQRLNWSLRSMRMPSVSTTLRRRGEWLGDLITSDRDLLLHNRQAA